MRTIHELILFKNAYAPMHGNTAEYWAAHGNAQTAETVRCYFEALHGHSRAYYAEAIITMATPGTKGGVCIQAGTNFNSPEIVTACNDTAQANPHTYRLNITDWFNGKIDGGTPGAFLWALSYGDGTIGPLIYQVTVELVLEPVA